MAKEYKVIVDQSLKVDNDPSALEKKLREVAREGWELRHVTSIVDATQDITPTSRIYMFFDREATTASEPVVEKPSVWEEFKKALAGQPKS